MTSVAEASSPKRRKFSKEVRRQQLIDATIASIAKRGFSETTLSHVAKTAGLSQGLVNLHFTSKENLLTETLRYLRDDYRHAWGQALEKAGDKTRDKLAAMIAVDYDAAVCDRKKLAVWFAFQGEAKSRPTYRKICQERDQENWDTMLSLISDLITQGKYKGLDAEDIASGLYALSEGLWLTLLVSSARSEASMSRKDARRISFTFAAQFFPKHFSVTDAEVFK